MTIPELLSKCELHIATTKKLAQCEPFCCDSDDLNEFFERDVVPFQKKLLGRKPSIRK